jgi:hypothetical protein
MTATRQIATTSGPPRLGARPQHQELLIAPSLYIASFLRYR